MNMKTQDTKLCHLKKFVRQTGVIHARDLPPLGIPHQYLAKLCAEGTIVKLGRGLYMTSSGFESPYVGLAQVAKAVPKSVVCLLSALRFHEIGTQSPSKIWIAIDRRSAAPRLDCRKIQVARFSGASLSEGIDEHKIAGVKVRIYNPAKTVADCFKYRNKIGLDIAIEALREALRERKCTVDELWRYANICRVPNVIRPYLEAVVCIPVINAAAGREPVPGHWKLGGPWND